MRLKPTIALIMLLSPATWAATPFPNFYNFRLSEPVTMDRTVAGPDLALISEAYNLLLKGNMKDSSVKTEVLLKNLGFEFQRYNSVPPYDFLITKTPSGFFISAYLGEVLAQKGMVALIFNQPLQHLTSRGSIEGLLLDPPRFLMSLLDPVAVVPHETTHFMHLREVRDGKFPPYISWITINNPKLNVYSQKFMVDEIEAHLSDARLYQHRGVIEGESFFDSPGKAALALMLALETRKAVTLARAAIAAEGAAYLKTIQFNLDKTFGSPGTEVTLYFLNEGQKQSIYTLSPRNDGQLEMSDVEEILKRLDNYAQTKIKEIMQFAPFSDFAEAEKILEEQSAVFMGGN